MPPARPEVSCEIGPEYYVDPRLSTICLRSLCLRDACGQPKFFVSCVIRLKLT